ncbi:unnamed protein product [Vitrella brassicaformis CCMP3155]|uniref:2Fe-2S ferredoxin-type domain-containing protein n=1 Tax=Vitrella brassicaformis (strain CCMP3155) TaxID=1169540 RepID=A0A0G4EHB4_VITBC|nr:unnamed protein product [Vitrella brassicaformis CCMP3155]|eukprot:CEL95372.1 unnamed protein product [Vitrella brassicaformis CCMP3155]
MPGSSAPSAGGDLVFTVDSREVRIPTHEVDPSVSLAAYLRDTLDVTNVKIGCAEGGCGACTVLVERLDPATSQTHRHTALSCLKPLPSVQGCAITTAHGLQNDGQRGDGPAVLHRRVQALGGSQCGYCTPGFVVSLYDALTGEDGELTSDKLAGKIDGNICRCTGYRPLWDVCRSFCKDAPPHLSSIGLSDIEDLTSPHQWPTPALPPALTGPLPSSLFTSSMGVTWHSPATLDEAITIWQQAKKDGAANVRLVFGNTSVGIYKDGPPSSCWRTNDTVATVIALDRVASLMDVSVAHKRDGGGEIRTGGGVSVSTLVKALEDLARGDGRHFAESHLTPLISHLHAVASKQVRNMGSVAGNLMLVHHKGFHSDLAPLLTAWEAAIEYIDPSSGTSHTLPLQSLWTTPPSHPFIVPSISIPLPSDEIATQSLFRSYRTSMRPRYAHAFANAAFWMELDPVVRHPCEVRLVVGAVGAVPQRAVKTESFLKTYGLTDETVREAVKLITSEISIDPSLDRHSFRQSLIGSYLYKFLVLLAAEEARGTYTDAHPTAPAQSILSAAEPQLSLTTPPIPSSHPAMGKVLPVDESTEQLERDGREKTKKADGKCGAVLWQPLPKPDAHLVSSGEARYTGDVGVGKKALYGVYVGSDQGNARLVAVDGSVAERVEGVVKVVTAADIPGTNTFCLFGKPLIEVMVPIGGRSKYFGQPAAVVLGTAPAAAEQATKLVKLTWDDVKPPVVTLAQAKAASTLTPIPMEAKKGDVSQFDDLLAAEGSKEGGLHVLRGVVECGSQLHFYMEPQAAYAVPDEDGTMTVWSSTQGPQFTHAGVANALNVPHNKVNIKIRRLGGAFGGKAFLSIPHAVNAAVAAKATNRPVRLVLNRNQDCAMTGGREEMEFEYAVAVDEKGRIHALKATIHAITGAVPGGAIIGCKEATETVDQTYSIPHLHVATKMYTANLPLRVPVRGPGGPEASTFIESVLQRIAHHLDLDPSAVRETNFYSPTATDMCPPSVSMMGRPMPAPRTLTEPYVLPRIWEELKATSGWEGRKSEVERFNAANRWRKRGLAMTTLRYPRPLSFSTALINVYKDGSVVLHHEGVEMGQGLSIKTVQTACETLGMGLCGETLPTSLVRMADLDTAFMPNPGPSAGSTASERMCWAIHDAATKLVDKLMPFCRPGDASVADRWREVITAADGARVSLQQQGEYKPLSGKPVEFYDTYGAAVSEVEIDVLTGERRIHYCEMLYDCGKSLNPLIDIGQAEGALVMGIGFHTSEEVVIDESTGRLLTDGTWEYKPPLAGDIPTDIRVRLLEKTSHPQGFASSKAVGEPPLLGSTSVFIAIQEAVRSAKIDAGLTGHFELSTPATCEKIQQACGTTLEHMVLRPSTMGVSRPLSAAAKPLPTHVDVAIVGGGLGGLLLCAGLRCRGIDAHVFERAPALRNASQGMFTASTNGMCAVRRVKSDIADTMLASGVMDPTTAMHQRMLGRSGHDGVNGRADSQ